MVTVRAGFIALGAFLAKRNRTTGGVSAHKGSLSLTEDHMEAAGLPPHVVCRAWSRAGTHLSSLHQHKFPFQ